MENGYKKECINLRYYDILILLNVSDDLPLSDIFIKFIILF